MLKASFARKIAAGLAVATTTTGLGLGLALNGDMLLADDHGIHPPSYPWVQKGVVSTIDHTSIRRGYEVYKQVCAACHSLKYTYYRQLVGVSHTEDEAKAEAAEAMVIDGPNDEGKMFERPGKLSDPFPSPYKNDEEAKFANNGAAPPDLSFITMARHNGLDYMFSILTRYADAPAGIEKKEGLHYHPYFPGSFIAMAKALYDDIIEYDDGTPATTSQLAKDVTNFLAWSSEKNHDDRKYVILKVALLTPPLVLALYYYKKRVFSIIKTKKVIFNPPKEVKKH